jgi:hypothetical protein
MARVLSTTLAYRQTRRQTDRQTDHQTGPIEPSGDPFRIIFPAYVRTKKKPWLSSSPLGILRIAIPPKGSLRNELQHGTINSQHAKVVLRSF